MRSRLFAFLILSVVPFLTIVVGIFVLPDDSPYAHSNFFSAYDNPPIEGRANIEPNAGINAFALGRRSAIDVFSGRLPLWDHHQGFGTPLLGAMQPAALFPPTWLMAFEKGQLIQQPLLQFVAGVGAFLFFRSFGLGVAAALTGGLLFEVNGVFAWLRNAIFNPVAFLPWLMFVVECLRTAAIEKQDWRRRVPFMCLGAAAGALALYAGFPEVTYLYCILVAFWTIYRMCGLSRSQNIMLSRDLAMTSLVALALSSPALLAFLHFLPESNIAGHEGDGFYGQTLFARSLIQHVLPYVYGPIWASYDPLILSVWGGTGGYIGLAPLITGIAALFARQHRYTKLFLVGWIIVALGVSYGVPIIYEIFMLLPLTKIAATYRYLNTSWIFCFIFLAALFVDSLPSMTHALRRRSVQGATIASTVLVGVAGIFAWPLLIALWDAPGKFQLVMIVALGLGIVIAIALLKSVKTVNAPRIVAGILIAEAIVWFAVPYFSTPSVTLNRPAIAFLQSHVGLQRIMGSFDERGYGLLPAYNSAFGISSLNYDNLPVPARTVAYVNAHLDPYATSLFLPWEPGLPPDLQAEREKLAIQRLPAYARVGVKYVLAGPTYDGNLKVAYQDPTITIYELPDVRGYFSASNCTLVANDHDHVHADCREPSKLTRLEAHMSGWTASIDGDRVPISLEDDTFQVIDLPAGRSDIIFTFMPAGLPATFFAAGIAFIMVVGGGMLPLFRARRIY